MKLILEVDMNGQAFQEQQYVTNLNGEALAKVLRSVAQEMDVTKLHIHDGRAILNQDHDPIGFWHIAEG